MNLCSVRLPALGLVRGALGAAAVLSAGAHAGFVLHNTLLPAHDSSGN